MRKMRVLCGALGLTLLVSLGINFVLFQTARSYYLTLQSVLLDPLGLNMYREYESAQFTSNQLRVVFFGDSRAYTWAETVPEIESFEIINRSIGGQTSSQALGRFNAHIAPLQPHIVVVQVGINDLKTIPLFPEQREEIVANYEDNIRQIVAKSRTLDATIVLTTIFPLGEVPLERRPFWSSEVGLAIEEVNAFIHTLAEDEVIVVDTAMVLADATGKVRSDYSEDLLHLTPLGYTALNEMLIPLLQFLASK